MMKALINGKILEGKYNKENNWFEVFGEQYAPGDIGCYEMSHVKYLPQTLERNQKARDAEYLFMLGENLVFGYGMPKGLYFLNLIKDPTKPSYYTTVSIETMLKKATPEQKTILVKALQDHVEYMEQFEDEKGWGQIERTLDYYKNLLKKL